eukprot:6204978-Pleurochrysis_carterae.AAC.4
MTCWFAKIVSIESTSWAATKPIRLDFEVHSIAIWWIRCAYDGDLPHRQRSEPLSTLDGVGLPGRVLDACFIAIARLALCVTRSRAVDKADAQDATLVHAVA